MFKQLPRDLKWEVLSEFVGSHAVRKGKLIKKLVFGDRHQMVQNIPRIHTCYIGVYNQDFNAKTYASMRDGSQLMFCVDPIYGEMGYTFRKRIVRECSWMPKCYGRQYTPMNNSVTLPTFAKRSYSSYEDTEKKKESRRPTKRPLSLRMPSSEEDTLLLPPPRSPDGPPPPRSPDGPPPPNPPTEAAVGLAIATVLLTGPPPI
jgi:hypothetical protein